MPRDLDWYLERARQLRAGRELREARARIAAEQAEDDPGGGGDNETGQPDDDAGGSGEPPASAVAA